MLTYNVASHIAAEGSSPSFLTNDDSLVVGNLNDGSRNGPLGGLLMKI